MTTMVKYEEQKQEMDYYRNLATIACKSCSKTMSIEDMMNVMLTARDLGISPMKAVNGGFFIVNGKIGMSTALMADRIRKAGHSIKIPEWSSQKCAVLGTRKDNGDSIKFEFTMDDAAAAGLLGSPVWKKFPKAMLYNRAMSTLARVLFPDVVGCAYSEDEKYDILDTPAEKRPVHDPDVIHIASADQSTQIVTLIENSFDGLKDLLDSEGIDTSRLKTYLQELSSKKQRSLEIVIESALDPNILPKFKQTYCNYLSRQASPVAETQ